MYVALFNACESEEEKQWNWRTVSTRLWDSRHAWSGYASSSLIVELRKGKTMAEVGTFEHPNSNKMLGRHLMDRKEPISEEEFKQIAKEFTVTHAVLKTENRDLIKYQKTAKWGEWKQLYKKCEIDLTNELDEQLTKAIK